MNDNCYWYDEEKEELAKTLFQHVLLLRREQEPLLESFLDYLCMYGNKELLGLSATQYSHSRSQEKLSLNIVKNMVDAARSKIGTKMPRASFLTSGGDASAKRKAKDLTKFVDGAFYETGIYTIAQLCFLDACLCGKGFLKVFPSEENVVRIERVFPDEIVTDAQESMYGTPESLYQLKTVNRASLKKKFPGHDELIDRAPTVDDPSTHYRTIRDTQTQVIEAWHLPTTPNSKDGRHVAICGEAVLIDEPWTKTTFPFCTIEWSPPAKGYWGLGLAHELEGLQYEINVLLITIRNSLKYGSVMRWLVPIGSNVNPDHLDDTFGAVIEHTPGMAPALVPFQSVHPDQRLQLEYLYKKAYELTGINQMMAQGVDAIGGANTSAIARQEINNQQSERFAAVGKAYEKFFEDAARQIISVARDIFMETGSYETKALAKGKLESIDWKDIDLEEDAYRMQVFPTGIIATHPAGRLEKVQEMMRSGLITDKDIARKLLDFPDLESEIGNMDAMANLVDMLVEAMLERGEYHAPEAFMDLNFAATQVTLAYLNARIEDPDNENLELLRTFITQCQDLLDQLAAKAAAQQAAVQGPPPGDEGGAPPQQ